MNTNTTKTTPEIHQWTHTGDRVLIVKCVNNDGTSHNGFKWPLTVGATVKPDYCSRKPDCGSGGLFGWPWGMFIGDGKDPNALSTWIVFSVKPGNVTGNIDGAKCKAVVDDNDPNECAKVEYVGTQAGAMQFTIMGRIAWIQERASGSSSATGYSGSSSATGDSGSSSATGDRGSSSATGDSGSSSATGYRGSSSATGARGIAATTSEYSTVESGPTGISVSTAYRLQWKAMKGAILVCRWEDPIDKTKHPYRVLKCSGKLMGAAGELVKIEGGKIVKEWSE